MGGAAKSVVVCHLPQTLTELCAEYRAKSEKYNDGNAVIVGEGWLVHHIALNFCVCLKISVRVKGSHPHTKKVGISDLEKAAMLERCHFTTNVSKFIREVKAKN